MRDPHDSQFEPEEDLGPSKTAVKKEMHELQQLGERLLGVPISVLSDLPLSAAMRAAIDEDKRIKSFEAKRRHLQYIGKLMRDHDVAAISLQLDLLDPSTQAHQQQMAEVEFWRTRLLTDSGAGLTEFLQQYPTTEIQSLRQLIRAVPSRDDGAPNLSHKAAKKLFQFLKETLLLHK